MHMQRVLFPAIQQMLSDRFNGPQSLTIQLFCSIVKSPLRRAHLKSLAGKIAVVIVCKTMDGVAFGHGI